MEQMKKHDITGCGRCTHDLAGIPDWYLLTFETVQQVDGGLRKVEIDLRRALQMQSLDQTVRREMESVLDALHAIKGSLVLVDMTARDVLERSLEGA